MADEKETKGAPEKKAAKSMGLIGVISKFPWMFLVIGYLIVVEQLGIQMDGTPAFIFVGGLVLIMFIETFKAMDLTPFGFFWISFGQLSAWLSPLRSWLICSLSKAVRLLFIIGLVF